MSQAGLMVGTRWRGTPLFVRLAQAVIRYYLASGLAWDYIVVRAEMEAFWTRLGYRRIDRNVDFPGVGWLAPLRLNLDRRDSEEYAFRLFQGSALMSDC